MVGSGTNGTNRRMETCSACAGDYEDPERTAGPTEEDAALEDDDGPGGESGGSRGGGGERGNEGNGRTER